MTTDLALVQLPEPKSLFDGSTMDAILADIAKSARSFVLDVTTEAGRKEIASVAYKVAQSKTTIDGQGKDLVAGIKDQAKKIDSERKKARDFLDGLKAEIRQPLTDFENAEKERVEKHETALEEIKSAILEIPETSEEIKAVINKVAAADPLTFEEFATKADAAKTVALDKLMAAYEKAKAAEAERAELERLRKEKEEREAKEREERIASEAAEKARREAEERAEREKKEREEAIEREKQEAQRKHEEELARQKAEAEAKERELREKAEAEERARQAEAERKAAEEKAAAEAEAKRQADEKHRAKIKEEIFDALAKAGIDAKTSDIVIDAIETGKIPHLQIQY